MATKIWVGTDTGNEGDWNTAANWSPSGVPVAGDDVIFEDSSQDVTAGLDQSSVLLDSLTIKASYTGLIGTDSAYLQIGATDVAIGQNFWTAAQNGSGRIKLDLGADPSTVVVYRTGNPSDSGKPALRLKCNHASTVVRVRKGTVGIAFESGEVSTLDNVIVSYDTNRTGDSDVYIGSGVTLATLTSIGGETFLVCGLTTLSLDGGKVTSLGTGAITTVNATGGSLESNSQGTITTLNIDGGAVDFTKSASSRTVTGIHFDGGQLSIDEDYVTVTNGISNNGGRLRYIAQAV